MQISIHDTSQDVGFAVASEIVNQMRQAQIKGRSYLLGCPGGRSPKPVYAALAAMTTEAGLDLSDVVLVMMDDYLEGTKPPFHHVPSNAHYSCRGFAFQEIAAVLNRGKVPSNQIRRENIWFPHPENPEAYDEQIAATAGIDMFILASGAGDGHIAFNPPGSPRDSLSRVVRLAERTRLDNMKTFPDFSSLAEVPEFGVTIGVGTIARHAKASAMILLGEDKKTAFDKITNAQGYDLNWPASIVRECRNAVLYADRAASEGATG